MFTVYGVLVVFLWLFVCAPAGLKRNKICGEGFDKLEILVMNSLGLFPALFGLMTLYGLQTTAVRIPHVAGIEFEVLK